MHPGDVLSLTIEVSIAIAGFSGIVVVLGRRQAGEWTSVDRLRLRGLLNASFAPIGISGFALVLLASDLPAETVWRVASALYAALFVLFFSHGMRQASNLPQGEVNRLHLVVVGCSGVAVSLLLVVNAVSLAVFWPMAVALGFQLVLALVNFVGLLNRAVSANPD